MKTLNQKRADYAFNVIKKIKGKKYEKDFSSLISKLPTLILSNGLGNTLAFLYSKGKEQHLIAIGIIANWIFNKNDLKIINGNFQENFFDDIQQIKSNIENVLKPIVTEATVEQYTFATEETLRLLNWLKRFSEAMLEKGEKNE